MLLRVCLREQFPLIDEKELKAWIARLETEQSSWPNYEKPAALYIIQNQHGGQSAPAPVAMYSGAPDPDVAYGDSGFMQTVSSRTPEQVWAIVAELMGALKVTNVRMYDNVMRKMRG